MADPLILLLVTSGTVIAIRFIRTMWRQYQEQREFREQMRRMHGTAWHEWWGKR